MKPEAGNSRQRGFTLVELLISITLIATLAIATHASLAIGLKARERAQAQVHHIQVARDLYSRLSQDFLFLAPAVPAFAVEDSTLSLLVLEREHQQSDGVAEPPIVLVQYRLTSDERGMVSCVRSANRVPMERGDKVTLLGFLESTQPGSDPSVSRGAITWSSGHLFGVRWYPLALTGGSASDWASKPAIEADAVAVLLGVSSAGGEAEADTEEYRFLVRIPPRRVE